MKICLLSFEYPPDTGYGGIGTYTWYHARALVKLGHSVHVLAGGNEQTDLTTNNHDGVVVHRFRARGFWMRAFRLLDRFSLWWTRNRLENALSMYRAFRILLRQHQYDLVEMPECGADGLFINNLISVPTVIKLHSPARLIMPFYDVLPADLRYCSFLEQLALRRGSRFSACSRFLAQEARNALGIKNPVRTIPNGIDIELFDSDEQTDIRKRFEIPMNRLIILFSARMERRKGIHLCKEIAGSILERFEVAFVFAGQDLFQYMESELLPYLNSRKLKGSFHYLGRLDQHMVRSCLRQSDIFLLPSLWENCPYSCLEAMAARCAIVSSDQGGMPELLQNGISGLLARNEDPASYISCLEKLIEDPSLRQQLGASARKTLEQSFTDIHIAKLTMQYYEEVLAEKSG